MNRKPIQILKQSFIDRIPKGSRDPIMRSFKLLKLFSTQTDGVTVPEIAGYLDVHKETARYWLFRLSLVLPIYESGIKQGDKGAPAVKYSLLQKD